MTAPSPAARNAARQRRCVAPKTGAVLLLALTAARCDRRPAAPPTARPLAVFATLYPLADIARQVGGDRVRADWLLRLGDPIAAFVPGERDKARMTNVDLLLVDGVGRTEIWAQRELDTRRETGGVASVDETPDAWRVPGDGLLVLDPVLAGQYAQYVAKLLSRRSPGDDTAFRRRANDFVAALKQASAAFTAPRDAAVVVLTREFDPLLTRFDVRPLLVTADPLHVTPRDAEAVRRTAAAGGAKSLIVPFDTPPGTRAHLEELTGLKVYALDPLGHPNYDGHASYLEVLRYNLDQLKLATTP